MKTFKHWCHYLKDSTHTVEVLTDHKNLQRFMKVKQLNKRQAQWAMQLTAFDFIISHKLRKINSADASSKHLNYEDVIQVSETMKQLLLTLQRKLVTLRFVLSSQYVRWVLSEVHWADEIRDLKFKNEFSESLNKALTQ